MRMGDELKGRSGGAPRILLAEDEVALARGISRILVSEGYDVVVVHDGAHAIAKLVDTEFDMILSDIQMPEITGVQMLREVRAHDLDVPVVLMTADPSLDTAIKAVELGALRYMRKPVAMDELLAVTKKAVQIGRLARFKREAVSLIGAPATEAGDRAGLIAAFDRAMDTMWIAFQPIVREGGEIFAYEALLRCDEPAIPHPGAFLGAAERLDRLVELGRRIRRLATESFRVHAPADALLFVNLHPRDLLDDELVTPTSALSRIASRVVLEITERAPLDGVRDLSGRLTALRALGFRIALDDLGAGYAGLTSFTSLEPEFVKLDMSLVQKIDASPMRQRVVASMAALCKDLGMQVVAEGVERAEERDAVVSLGCGLLQGYLFARPARLG